MKSVFKVLGVLMVVLVCLSSPVSECFGKDKVAAAGTASATDATMEWEGSESKQAAPFIGVITTETEWNSLWERAFGKQAPQVDFRTSAVASVFLGHYPGWWYTIKITEPYVEANSVIIPYEIVSLVVEPQGASRFGEQGSKGQYRMRTVEKKAGCDFEMKELGAPQVPIRGPVPTLFDQ